jgi:chemotaxis protein CheZ
MNPALSAAPLQPTHVNAAGRLMPVQRKVFRIEQMGPLATPAAAFAGDAVSELHQQEILTELKALRDLMERRERAAPFDPGALKSSDLRELKDETGTISRAISRTRQEIAALQASALNGLAPGRVARELDAVIEDAERATQHILDAAEAIEEAANSLSASLKNKQEQALAQDIQDQVIALFEACNFQDLSGQRITKVLATLKFVEDHIARMMEIWGGIPEIEPQTGAARAAPVHEGRLVYGPKIKGDPGHASQGEIDVLFAKG